MRQAQLLCLHLNELKMYSVKMIGLSWDFGLIYSTIRNGLWFYILWLYLAWFSQGKATKWTLQWLECKVLNDFQINTMGQFSQAQYQEHLICEQPWATVTTITLISFHWVLFNMCSIIQSVMGHSSHLSLTMVSIWSFNMLISDVWKLSSWLTLQGYL